MDFGAFPPEINSGRMYAGPGAGSMLAAAGAWDGLAADLHSTAAAAGSVVSGLTGQSWQGASSTSMAAAVAPYLTWMSATATQLEQVANQARAAAAAYEAAFAMTVPPAVVAANRAQLMALIATNILGQNTPAIMATEAHYGEMWAQDAAAMYGYAASSAAASALTPFTPPKSTTNPAGLTGSVRRGGPVRRHSRRQPRADRRFDIAVGGFSNAAGPLAADAVGVRPLGTVVGQRCDGRDLRRLGSVWRAECADGSGGFDGQGRQH